MRQRETIDQSHMSHLVTFCLVYNILPVLTWEGLERLSSPELHLYPPHPRHTRLDPPRHPQQLDTQPQQ